MRIGALSQLGDTDRSFLVIFMIISKSLWQSKTARQRARAGGAARNAESPSNRGGYRSGNHRSGKGQDGEFIERGKASAQAGRPFSAARGADASRRCCRKESASRSPPASHRIQIGGRGPAIPALWLIWMHPFHCEMVIGEKV